MYRRIDESVARLLEGKVANIQLLPAHIIKTVRAAVVDVQHLLLRREYARLETLA